ncbi:hypothetical protein IE81DRAFT_344653 [Ceraceosorus guamensis]|uniref:Uncharacterized protein n=1 Tax=Ceraceosorus guamensis TaxID=1522189 RepID=A0A316WAK3_9BASI|nr:hypothetical protein IE81DRAFT_344653 [Ceraceosorus guamensis]PWN45761.1 hypothetical protein IE81DRAFT_344653 [Ceraceosorus guamensis]
MDASFQPPLRRKLILAFDMFSARGGTLSNVPLVDLAGSSEGPAAHIEGYQGSLVDASNTFHFYKVLYDKQHLLHHILRQSEQEARANHLHVLFDYSITDTGPQRLLNNGDPKKVWFWRSWYCSYSEGWRHASHLIGLEPRRPRSDEIVSASPSLYSLHLQAVSLCNASGILCNNPQVLSNFPSGSTLQTFHREPCAPALADPGWLHFATLLRLSRPLAEALRTVGPDLEHTVCRLMSFSIIIAMYSLDDQDKYARLLGGQLRLRSQEQVIGLAQADCGYLPLAHTRASSHRLAQTDEMVIVVGGSFNVSGTNDPNSISLKHIIDVNNSKSSEFSKRLYSVSPEIMAGSIFGCFHRVWHTYTAHRGPWPAFLPLYNELAERSPICDIAS